MIVWAVVPAVLLAAAPALAYIESVAASVDNGSAAGNSHASFVPLVAFQCGYRNQYSKPDGRWVSDESRTATCMTAKMDILKYCRRTYPHLEITNIVEYDHHEQIDNWCKEEGSPCKWSHTVRPYRCIVGEFTGQPLQVPPGCRFGHVNDQHKCSDFGAWQRTAENECGNKLGDDKRTMRVRSFAMLEPCGVDMFSGVEFVCCPQTSAVATPAPLQHQPAAAVAADKSHAIADSVFDADASDWDSDEEEDDDSYDEDEDAYDDDDYEDDDDEDEDDDQYWDDTPTKPTSTRAPETTSPTGISENEQDDPYFRLADPDNEHALFKQALARLEKKHEKRIAKVMQDWAELETRYAQLKKDDPVYAEKFKKDTQKSFQATVKSLEAEIKEQRHQMHSVHSERVMAHLNEKKRQTIHSFRDALADGMDKKPNTQRVLNALEAYIRAEEKDRIHSLNHFVHLLKTDATAAWAERATLLHRLYDIDLRINGTVQMLRDFDELKTKVEPAAVAFWAEYRRENTPHTSDPAAVSLGAKGKDERLISLYETMFKLHEDEQAINPAVQDLFSPTMNLGPVMNEPEEPLHFVVDEQEQQPDMLARQDKLVHQHEGWSSEQVTGASHHAFGLLAAAGLLAVVLGVLMLKRRRSHHNQGFIEVDLYTPEEKHVAGMQFNGYENPTYTYFEKA